MDDLKILDDMWEHPAPAAPPVQAAARARLLALAGDHIMGGSYTRRRRTQGARLKAWLISAGATAAATAAAAGVVISATATGPGTTQIHTTAYVVRHAERALAAVAHGRAIQQTQFAATRNLVLGAYLTPRRRSPTSLEHMNFSKVTVLSYGDRSLVAGFRSGKLLIEAGPSTPTRPNGHQAPARPVLVNRLANTWYHPLSMPAPAQPGTTCSEVRRALNNAAYLMGRRTEASPARWIAMIRAALACHEFKAHGRQRVDGVEAIKLTATASEVKHQQGAHEVLWVNAKTYLPVRISFGPNTAAADFRWLRPTADNLAKLQVTIPPGAVARRLPAHTGILFWQLGIWR
ncbi:MAG: hypothetical protein LBV34_08885 [Nocardiopsaceae bacterium]|jgi:hypothetical protein|nr:hypothetical protein [Nocardiopsaceae bacterium]